VESRKKGERKGDEEDEVEEGFAEGRKWKSERIMDDDSNESIEVPVRGLVRNLEDWCEVDCVSKLRDTTLSCYNTPVDFGRILHDVRTCRFV